MKTTNIIFRVLFALLTLSPILGALGIFPAPTPDLYNTPEAFTFINTLYQSGYLIFLMAIVFAITFGLIITNRMALASLLVLPVTVNIISFHLFLDGGLLQAGAIMAVILAALNIYFLWQNRAQYKSLLHKSAI